MKWKKGKVLGRGSFGTVYFGEADEFMAAVKSVDLSCSSSLTVEKEYLMELRGCTRVIQFFEDYISIEMGTKVYNIVLEYAPGGTLYDLMKSRAGKMSQVEIARYAEMLLTGLSQVHARGIVHCDVKPENVLVFPTRDGVELKLADFGLAKNAGEREIHTSIKPSYHRGTLLYSSPESVGRGIHEPAKDIWSLGCIFFKMITGQSMWTYKSKEDLAQQIRDYKTPEIPGNISAVARNFLKKCLERKPEERWTADMLLRHSFIVDNTKFSDQTQGVRHLSFDQLQRDYSPALTYKLFPEKSEAKNGFSIPCGAELIQSLFA